MERQGYLMALYQWIGWQMMGPDRMGLDGKEWDGQGFYTGLILMEGTGLEWQGRDGRGRDWTGQDWIGMVNFSQQRNNKKE